MEERTDFYSHQGAEFSAGFGFEKFSFPELNFADQMLPDLDKEINWLREHVEKGSLDETILAQRAHTVHIDTRPCPQFLLPYDNDSHFLGQLIARLRETGKIPQRFEDWGKDAVDLVLPKASRFGLSVSEIEEFVIPAVKQQLNRDSLKVRLPTIGELLYLRLRVGIFPDQAVDYAHQTREWTSTPYSETSSNDQIGVLGNVFVSAKRKDSKSGGVYWWFNSGDLPRLPSIGFRLVIEQD